MQCPFISDLVDESNLLQPAAAPQRAATLNDLLPGRGSTWVLVCMPHSQLQSGMCQQGTTPHARLHNRCTGPAADMGPTGRTDGGCYLPRSVL